VINPNTLIKNKDAHQHCKVSNLPKFLFVLFISCEVLIPSTCSFSASVEATNPSTIWHISLSRMFYRVPSITEHDITNPPLLSNFCTNNLSGTRVTYADLKTSEKSWIS